MKIIGFFLLLLLCSCNGGGGDTKQARFNENETKKIDVKSELSTLSSELPIQHSLTKSELDQLLADNVISTEEHQELLLLVQN